MERPFPGTRRSNLRMKAPICPAFIESAKVPKPERPDIAGLITATRGNHGQSIAYAASRYRVPVTIYVPRGNSVEKNRAMRAFGAKLVEYGEDFQAAREECERRAKLDGLEIVPSIHPDLVMGVATYALELLRKV